MKKLISLMALGLLGATASFTLTSCDLFESDGFSERNIGNLDNSRNISDLPSGYRVKTVGDEYRYIYKTNGKLDEIRISGKSYDMDRKSVKIEGDDFTEKYDFTFNTDDLLTKIKLTHREDNSDDKSDGTAKFTYNSDKQLTKITVDVTEYYVEDGKDCKYTAESTYEYTYNGRRIRRIKQNVKETETIDGVKETAKFSKTIGFDYDDDEDYINVYYQWTPNYTAAVLGDTDDFVSAMAYIGLLGRASSELPYAITADYSGSNLDDEDMDESSTTRCRYSKNSYDAIRTADGKTYTYTEKDDDYEVKAAGVDFEEGLTTASRATDARELAASLRPAFFRLRSGK